MRPLKELIDSDESAWPLVQEIAHSVPGRCEVYPPSESAGEVLYRTQVTTRSPMGAIAFHTGGVSVLNGWLRFLGSGSSQIPRSLADWNVGRASGFYLVADDVFGGFFAIDGGAFGQRLGTACYFSPRSLQWEPLDCTYTELFEWACTDFGEFYADLVWEGCDAAIASVPPDRCFFFMPPLWATECILPPASIRDIPVTESWGVQMDFARQLD